MTGLSREVADREKDRSVLCTRFLDRFRSPGIPVHRIIGVLLQVRAGLVGEPIGGVRRTHKIRNVRVEKVYVSTSMVEVSACVHNRMRPPLLEVADHFASPPGSECAIDSEIDIFGNKADSPITQNKLCSAGVIAAEVFEGAGGRVRSGLGRG